MPRKGQHQSPEAREKIRQANLGKRLSPEARDKLRQANLGKTLPLETREKLRQANLGRPTSLGTRQKLRQAALKQWATPEIRERMEKALAEYFLKMPRHRPNEYVATFSSGRHGYIHRVVWEQANGAIPKGHVVHHINGVRDDNRLENLALMTSHEHGKLHGRTPARYALSSRSP